METHIRKPKRLRSQEESERKYDPNNPARRKIEQRKYKSLPLWKRFWVKITRKTYPY